MRLSFRAPLLLASLLVGSAAFAACGDGDAANTDESTGGGRDGGADSARDATSPQSDAGGADSATTTDASVVDAGADAEPTSGPPNVALPVSFSRNDVGTPLTSTEISTATDELIALLKDLRYFDFVDERVHGWPETDPAHGYWYGHFWTGVQMLKSAGKVTYKHSTDGADNVGIATAPYLEGACYAYLMWGEPKVGHLLQRMVRAYSAWIMAMVRSNGDTNPTLLARSFYRPNVDSTEGGRNLTIDYSQSYPGVDADPSEYVHVPTNPTFGDIWIKNKRSKDDMGHILRSLSQVKACVPRLDAAAQADVAQMTSLYESWAKRVAAQGFVIETLDKSENLWSPPDQLARYTLTGNLECLGAAAIMLRGNGALGSIDCKNGLPTLEVTAWSFLKNDARQILRTHHQAAIVAAYQKSQNTPALDLLGGLAGRMDLDMNLAESASPPSGFSLLDVTSEIAASAAVGVPLTSREIRWMHKKLHEAYVGMRDPAQSTTFHVFDSSVPDGIYSYDPPNIGVFFRDLGMMLGTCASPYRNPTGRAAFDCQKLVAAF